MVFKICLHCIELSRRYNSKRYTSPMFIPVPWLQLGSMRMLSNLDTGRSMESNVLSGGQCISRQEQILSCVHFSAPHSIFSRG